MAIDPDFVKALDRLKIILKKRIYADRQGEHHAEHGGDSLVYADRRQPEQRNIAALRQRPTRR